MPSTPSTSTGFTASKRREKGKMLKLDPLASSSPAYHPLIECVSLLPGDAMRLSHYTLPDRWRLYYSRSALYSEQSKPPTHRPTSLPIPIIKIQRGFFSHPFNEPASPSNPTQSSIHPGRICHRKHIDCTLMAMMRTLMTAMSSVGNPLTRPPPPPPV